MRVHPQAEVLGASLEAGKDLYSELQEMYEYLIKFIFYTYAASCVDNHTLVTILISTLVTILICTVYIHSNNNYLVLERTLCKVGKCILSSKSS